jgi:hypothetical protein
MPYTRRDKQKLLPGILTRYRDLLQRLDFEGLDKLIEEYAPQLSEEKKRELREDFKQYAEKQMRRNWRAPK